MLKLIGYATPEYRAALDRLERSARPFFDAVVKHGPQDIDPAFKQANARLFGFRRGGGYWIWKPYFILRHVEQLGPDDGVMYCDSQCVFERDPRPLFDLVCRHEGIGLFHQRREKHRNSTWTRRDAFVRMGCDSARFHDGDNLATTFSVWTRTEKSIAFLREWLRWCCDYDVVSDEPSGAPNLPGFRDHRHDQSIASILAIRDGLFTLCDPSQFGDGFRCKECGYPRILRVDRSVVAPYLPRPTSSTILEVSAVATCPMRCTYCPQDKLEAAYRGPQTLTPQLFARCLDNLIPQDSIYFAGFVEPCLNPHILDLLELAIARGHRVQLYTTGRGLNRVAALRIATMPIEKIVLHLPDAEGHLSHCEQTAAILDILATHPGASVMAMDNQPHPEVGLIWNRIPRNPGAMHDRAGNLTILEHRNRSGPIKCGAAPALDHSVLLPSGELALCCMDYSLEAIVGNLAETPYGSIITGPARTKIKQAQESGSECICRRCVCAVPA